MPSPRTSESDPIIVNFLEETPWPGRVGLTFAPGKWQEDAETGVWHRNLTQDLDHLASKYQTAVLVSLLEEHERRELLIPSLLDEATGRGWQVLPFPITDGGIPSTMEAVAVLTSAIIAAAQAGRNVVIHCKGGKGRAGTIGGCVLVASGKSPDDALRLVRQARGKGTPENDKQKQFIRDFRDYVLRQSGGVE